MADRKISDLTALTTPAAGDYLPIVDVSEASASNKNKRITIEELLRGAPDGTAAAPSIAFESDGGNGLYLAGTDTIGVSTNGVNRLTVDTAAFSSTLPIVYPLGAVGTPSITFTGDLNTGFWSPAADTLAASTAGSERLRITSTGNVGVGTPSPGAIWHTVNTSAGAATVGAFIQNSSLAVGTEVRLGFAPNTNLVSDNRYSWIGAVNETGSNGSSLTFATTPGGQGATERMRIDSSGRVLVGTSTARANFYNSTLSALFQQEGAASAGDPASRFMSLTYGKGSNDSGVFIFAKHRATTVGGQTVVVDGDSLGELNFQGSDGTEFVQAASIRAAVDGTPGADDMPGRLVFSVTADGASSPTERLRITNAGVLQVADAGNIAVGTTTGTKIGTATTQKLGFFNATPVVQPTAVADATDAASVITQLNALLTRMRNLGLIAT